MRQRKVQLQSMEKDVYLSGSVLQQDKDPRHTFQGKKYVKNKRRDNRSTVLNWPLQSPDMNIIVQV